MTLRAVLVAALLLAAVFTWGPSAAAVEQVVEPPSGLAVITDRADAGPNAASAAADDAPEASHRLIVALASPPLVTWAETNHPDDPELWGEGQRLNVHAPEARRYIRQLELAQDAFVKHLAVAVPGAEVATFLNERHQERELRYQILMNGLAIDAGLHADLDALEARLRALPSVTAVYRDYSREPAMYASLPLINAEGTWNRPEIGGIANAGAGVKVASVDGGIHAQGQMFRGDDYTMPPGYPIGHLDNTNAKVIVSRAYFRTWDPPAEGDQNPWPGENGTPHGQHTASTAVGNAIESTYRGLDVTLSGVAPSAYAMSYRVFYPSIGGRGSLFEAEGIASHEDLVRDGAHAANNSWGAGPYSYGGDGDALDLALINATRAGVFVSMSAGNAGPSLHSVDHPSGDYINVAASTTDGNFIDGTVEVTAPEPVTDTLKGIRLAYAGFGPLWETGTVVGPYPYLPASAVDAENVVGCDEFPPDAFTGKVAVISRGGCPFVTKVLNAQNAGADYVVVYNSAAGGDTPFGMGGGSDQIEIPSLMVGHSPGLAIVDWHTDHPDEARLAVNTTPMQVGNTPDIIAGFSSRGPAVGDRLKPDIAAPGVNILAEGFAYARGEDRHLSFGEAGGTSMAAPHVAGAAALLKQVHPDWSPDSIKSALMSTSKFENVYVDAGMTTPAQPLDMGAGRLDLTNAADPGVILSPPSLSFGRVEMGETPSIAVELTSVSDATETYTIETADTTEGFDAITALAGMTVTPSSVTLDPGQTGIITVTWSTDDTKLGIGDNQGFVVMTSDSHKAHMPAWMRVGYPDPGKDVLILDNDGSSLPTQTVAAFFPPGTAPEDLPTYTDYTAYYTETLDAAGIDYDVMDIDTGNPASIPDANYLSQYDIIVHQTGDNPLPIVPGAVQRRLQEFSNSGGRFVGFGQNLSSVFQSANPNNPNAVQVFYGSYLASRFLQDSVNAGTVFTQSSQLILGVPGTPLAGLAFDVSALGDGAGNQASIDELRPATPDSRMRGADETVNPILMYGAGGDVRENGYVAMSNTSRPSLEHPGLSWLGRSLHFGFGLEGVNSDTGFGTRQELMDLALGWVSDAATVTITPTMGAAHQLSRFEAALDSSHGGGGVSYRWDFGDGSPFTIAYPVGNAGHTYHAPGTYTVRVEATNVYGTRVMGHAEVTVGEVLPGQGFIDRWNFIYLPTTSKNHTLNP